MREGLEGEQTVKEGTTMDGLETSPHGPHRPRILALNRVGVISGDWRSCVYYPAF